MKLIALALLALVLSGCASDKDPKEVDPQVVFRNQRIEIVAKSLVSEGRAANLEEARPLAAKIVAREESEQIEAEHINNAESRVFNEGDKRVQ
jgi:uncharacterized protein YcfL